MKRKAINLALISNLVFSSFTPFAAEASEQKEQINQNGIQFITISDEKYEYLLEKEGMKYKYIEKIDGNKIFSDIYVFNSEKKDYIKTDALETTVTIENITIKEGENTTIVKNPLNIQSQLQKSLLNNENTIAPFALDEGNGNWVYQSTSYGSSKAKQFTLAAISLTVSMISKVPTGYKWVANMASLYFSFGKDIVYYRYETYKRGSGILTELNPG